MDSHSLLQGIFPTQGSTLCVLHCRQTSFNAEASKEAQGNIRNSRTFSLRKVETILIMKHLSMLLKLHTHNKKRVREKKFSHQHPFILKKGPKKKLTVTAICWLSLCFLWLSSKKHLLPSSVHEIQLVSAPSQVRCGPG